MINKIISLKTPEKKNRDNGNYQLSGMRKVTDITTDIKTIIKYCEQLYVN